MPRHYNQLQWLVLLYSPGQNTRDFYKTKKQRYAQCLDRRAECLSNPYLQDSRYCTTGKDYAILVDFWYYFQISGQDPPYRGFAIHSLLFFHRRDPNKTMLFPLTVVEYSARTCYQGLMIFCLLF